MTGASAVLLEQYRRPGMVASAENQNSGTLHEGLTEQHYDLSTSLRVQEKSRPMRVFMEANPQLGARVGHLLLGVGIDEILELGERFDAYKAYYPIATLHSGREVDKIEPLILEGRGDDEVAVIRDEGWAVDYGRVAEHLVDEARRPGIEFRNNAPVRRINRDGEGYRVAYKGGEVTCDFLIISAGARSLSLAHQLGIGTDYTIFPVAGGWFTADIKLQHKIYAFQQKEVPFAAFHFDPAPNDMNEIRGGPYAHPALGTEWGTIERQVLESYLDPRVIAALPKVLKGRLGYFAKSMLFAGPFGKRFALPDAQKLIPSLNRLTPARHLGGIRPQVVDLVKQDIVHADLSLYDERLIVNLSASPGASVALAIADENATKAATMLGIPKSDAWPFTAVLDR
jgi:malate dehydrogenase (quinone)